MKRAKVSLGSIDATLRRAARLLDRAALQIRDAKLAPSTNVRKIGKALAHISNCRSTTSDGA